MSNIKLIDLHTHILPFVDDGSDSYDLSEQMVNKMINDGITDIVLTPHNYKSVTKVDRATQLLEYQKFKDKFKHLKTNFYLGSEVTYRETFDIDYSSNTINNSSYVLVEFRDQAKIDILTICYDLIKKGFIPIIAHIERINYLIKEDYFKLRDLGVLFQVNSSAILGKRDRRETKLTKYLIKEKLVDFVASDCHNMTSRMPDLKESYLYLLSKKIDENYLENIYYNNQKEVLK